LEPALERELGTESGGVLGGVLGWVLGGELVKELVLAWGMESEAEWVAPASGMASVLGILGTDGTHSIRILG